MQIKNAATLILPQYLLLVLIISAISITLLITGVMQLKEKQDIDQIEQTLNTIISTAETMATMAQEGASIPLKINIPSSTDFLIFGNHPDIYTSMNHTRNETYHLAHYCGYQTTQGYRKTYCANVAFYNTETNNATILYAGTHELILTLHSKHGESYVTIIVS